MKILLYLLVFEYGLVNSFLLSTGRISSPGPSAEGQLSPRQGSLSDFSSLSSFSLGINETNPYNFWDENYTLALFNSDLHNLAMENPIMAIDLLGVMENVHEKEDNQNLFLPDSASYTTVIEGLCYGNRFEGTAEKAQALLDKMEKSIHLEPSILTYLLVGQKWADSYKHDYTGANAQKAHAILLGLTRRNKQPSGKLYGIVLEGWCRRVGKVGHAMEKAEKLLQEMERAGGSVRPNVLSYTSVISALARSRFPDLATRADEMLPRMKIHGVEPDMVAYTSILNCWSKAVSRNEREQADTRACEILRLMEARYIKHKDYNVKPSVITYVTAMRAIGNSLNPNAPSIAENLLRDMYKLRKTEKISIDVNTSVWNAVITCYSRSGAKRKRLVYAKRAEELLMEMLKRSHEGEAAIEPNVRTWGAVLRAWAGSMQPDSGEQAQRVLNKMGKMYEEGRIAFPPNVVCYTTVMNAWGRGGASSQLAVRTVETMLKTMEKSYEQTLDLEIRPNKITYITALDVFSRKCNEDVGSKSQATVDRMMFLYSKGLGHDRPTRIVFNALINAWSRSNERGAAENAEKILNWMEAQYRAGDDFVRPDEVTLCGVLNAWANHAENGGAQRAEQIMNHTESLALEERGFAHSTICYNILIKAWGRSRAVDSVQRAEAILKRLEQNSSSNQSSPRPDITTYSSVVNCCAYYTGKTKSGRAEAIDVAMRTFRRIEEIGEKPNHICYGTLFKAISKLTAAGGEREEMIETLFTKCKLEGQVDSFVLSQVRAASSAETFHQLVLSKCSPMKERENKNILRSMPQSWNENVIDYT